MFSIHSFQTLPASNIKNGQFTHVIEILVIYRKSFNTRLSPVNLRMGCYACLEICTHLEVLQCHERVEILINILWYERKGLVTKI